MSDHEFIRYLWRLLWKSWTKESIPTEDEVYLVKTELNKRNIKTEF